jgi:DNA repair protein RecN (Recombination protein N)
MLRTLSIRDLAVVDALDLDLHNGLSVLTGETGAGKSILLTALGLALGDRADSGYVRNGSKRAEVTLNFDLSDAPIAQQWLLDNELDDDEQCLIRRTISDDGRSKAYINNSPVNLQTLQSLSKHLVEIHGQHAHLTLLDSDEQRRLLDSFADNHPLLTELADCYQHWKRSDSALQHLLKANTDQSEREEMLRYQLDELQQLDLTQFDYSALSEAHQKQAHIGQILSVGQQQLALLYDNDQQSLCDMLSHSLHALNDLAQYAPELNPITTLLAEADIQLNEASQQLRRFLDNLELDPQQLAELEQQLSLIQRLSRKHKIAPEQLPALADELERALNTLQHSSEHIEQLSADSQRYLQHYRQLADTLSKRRQQAANQLQQRISDTIQALGMPHGQFSVRIEHTADAPPQRHGNDAIAFWVSTNPGLPPKPLAKVASGGELSRISLAIQVTTSTDKTTPTMIFDEVDAGIGGGVAEMVGQKLQALSHNRQVLCVTHLPQVAAQAHHHLFVAKNQHSTLTASTVTTLDSQQRVIEIARMLGGVTLTENTLAHAKEMLAHGAQTATLKHSS